MLLDEDQINRYSRQIILQGVGSKGQEKLLNSSVLIIGMGGLGSPAALYLAAAGVGTIGIIDGDIVDVSNLHRQIIHFTADVQKAKVISAKEKMEKINPDVNVITYQDRVHSGNISDIIKNYNFIIDGTDNFPAKFLINDACVINKKPFNHAGILRFTGQTLTYTPGNTCYRCIFNEPPPEGVTPSCSQAGILGPVAGILGSIQASEALKFILGIGKNIINQMLIINVFEMNFRIVNINRNENCPVCGNDPIITKLIDYEQQICDLRDRNEVI